MRRTEYLQETWKMRFKEMYLGWQSGKLSQEEAAMVLGVCPGHFVVRSAVMRRMVWKASTTSD